MGKSFVILFLVGIAIASIPLSAQPPDTMWTRTYGGSEIDTCYWAEQTFDGGYIFAGWTASYGDGLFDAYLIKTDNDGDTMWTRTYGGSNRDYAWSVVQTPDSGYIVGGRTYSFGEGWDDFWLLRLDNTGDTLWTSTWGEEFWEAGLVARPTSDGGYIQAGPVMPLGDGVWHGCLAKTDSAGDILWTKSYGGGEGEGEYLISAFEVSDGYISAGGSFSFGPGDIDVWLVKTDTAGDTMWTRTYGTASDIDSGYVVQPTFDGGFVIVGSTRPILTNISDVLLVKTDSVGELEWSRTYGGDSLEGAFSVVQTHDGGFVISGRTRSFGAGDWDVWLIKTDANGDTMWTKTVGGVGADKGFGIQITSDGGYVVAGATNNYGVGNSDCYVVKTKPLLDLTSPNGGEELTGGDIINITWSYENPAQPPHSYMLLFSMDGGSSYADTIASDIDPADTSYAWEVPHHTSGDCRVKIQLVDGETNVITEDASDGSFSMTGIEEQPAGQPLLKVTSSLNMLTYEVSGDATLTLYSADGRKITHREISGSGVWDAPAELTNGVYFVIVSIEGHTTTGKLVVIR